MMTGASPKGCCGRAFGLSRCGGEYAAVGLRLLQHQPHTFHVEARTAPVALGVEIAEKELALQPMGDRGDASGVSPAHRALVVEQNAVRGRKLRDNSP
jgi:hypothetical protein